MNHRNLSQKTFQSRFRETNRYQSQKKLNESISPSKLKHQQVSRSKPSKKQLSPQQVYKQSVQNQIINVTEQQGSNQCEVQDLKEGMYIQYEGRPCQIVQIQKILKYNKEFKKSIPYRYMICKDLYVKKMYQQFFYSGMTVELIKVEWKVYLVDRIVLEDGKNEIWAAEKANPGNQKIFIMPADRMELCKQIWNIYKNGKQQVLRTICTMGEEQIDTAQQISY